MFEKFIDKARRVLVLAQEEAREGNGVAMQALMSMGIDGDQVRSAVQDLISSNPAPVPFAPPGSQQQGAQPPIAHRACRSLHSMEGLARFRQGKRIAV